MIATTLLAALAGLLAPLPLRRLLLAWRMVDTPNHRSSHRTPVLKGGGLAVMAAITVAVAMTAWSSLTGAVLLVAIAIAVIGLVDDVRGLSAGARLAGQFGLSTVGVLTVTAVVGVDGTIAYLWLPVAVMWVVAYVNAFNFMDGINGISALNAALAGGYLAWLGAAHSPELVALALAVAGASVGFLPWNAPAAKLFLGDVGSYGLGALLALIALSLWLIGAPLLGCVAPFAVYLADTGSALARRVRAGRPLCQAHREHVYQRLVDAGWSHVQAGFATTLAAALAITFVETSPAPIAWTLMLAVAVGYLGLPRLVGAAAAPATLERAAVR